MCSKIKTNVDTCHLPFIILTAKDSIQYEKELLETGADEYITKPFHMDLLELRINNIIRTREKFYDQFQTQTDAFMFKEAKNENDREFIEKAVNLITDNLTNDKFNVQSFSEGIGMSRTALFYKLKEITKLSTTEFIRSVKLKEALHLMRQDKYNISEITFLAGFSDPKYFRTCFKKMFGQTPSEYMKRLKQQVES